MKRIAMAIVVAAILAVTVPASGSSKVGRDTFVDYGTSEERLGEQLFAIIESIDPFTALADVDESALTAGEAEAKLLELEIGAADINRLRGLQTGELAIADDLLNCGGGPDDVLAVEREIRERLETEFVDPIRRRDHRHSGWRLIRCR